MKNAELNRIIREKILSLKETEQMKAFLLDVMDTELRNLNMARARYTKDYLQSATLQSKMENRGE
jgi:hypothetical protein